MMPWRVYIDSPPYVMRPIGGASEIQSSLYFVLPRSSSQFCFVVVWDVVMLVTEALYGSQIRACHGSCQGGQLDN